jgi:hypothetical protein
VVHLGGVELEERSAPVAGRGEVPGELVPDLRPEERRGPGDGQGGGEVILRGGVPGVDGVRLLPGGLGTEDQHLGAEHSVTGAVSVLVSLLEEGCGLRLGGPA